VVGFGLARLGGAWHGMKRQDNYRTNLEKAVADALTALSIQFREQVPVRSGFVLDFVVKSPILGDVIVEADGPTHETPEGRKKTYARNHFLRDAGWKHIWHLDQETILDPEKLNARLIKLKE
jgi:very-short-patch-repair endonuclease